MRITPEEQKSIVELTRLHFGDDATVKLFGSRVDDKARGGDIDLFVEANVAVNTVHARRIGFLAELKHRIGDRRIDVVVRTPDSTPQPVFDIAERDGILIS